MLPPSDTTISSQIARKTKAWAESLEKNGWTPAVLTGADFESFVDNEFASMRAVMVKSGMI